jgi:hypothetical protein
MALENDEFLRWIGVGLLVAVGVGWALRKFRRDRRQRQAAWAAALLAKSINRNRDDEVRKQ